MTELLKALVYIVTIVTAAYCVVQGQWGFGILLLLIVGAIRIEL